MAERDARGRFSKGHKPYRKGGRPPREQEHTIRKALEQCMAPDEVLSQLARAIAMREQWAVTLYLGYYWGKPKERQEIKQWVQGQTDHDFNPDAIAEAFAILEEVGAFGATAGTSGPAQDDTVHSAPAVPKTDSVSAA